MTSNLAASWGQRPASVLVADDEAPLRDLYTMILRGQGYQVAAAGDGQAALGLYRQALAEGEPFGVVLLDLCMPGLDGLGCARAILEDDPWARVILATGSCSVDLGDLLDRLAGVLLKPISLRGLLREVTACQAGQALAGR
ncbi:MAG: response regulator [Pseudomonadota bacterium]